MHGFVIKKVTSEGWSESGVPLPRLSRFRSLCLRTGVGGLAVWRSGRSIDLGWEFEFTSRGWDVLGAAGFRSSAPYLPTRRHNGGHGGKGTS